VSYSLGIDIGGTFTDIVFLDDDGRVHTKKVSSSVDDYARAIVEGVRELFRETSLAGDDVSEVLHGTTVASNAILELQGARTGLITTRGFRDVLEIRRLRMPRLYDIAWEKPVPLVERYLRREVSERIDAQGEIKIPLDPAEVEGVLAGLLAEGIEALAVCLLNSYANPVHEARIKEIVTGVSKAMGGRADITYKRGYPSTINSEREAAFAAQVGERVFGKANVFTDAEPTMGGEDFSFMLQARPGAYVFLGQGGGPNNCFLHNPAYDFNDDVIPLGAGYLAALVEASLPLK